MTDRQIEANRRNATKSTGPKSTAGKATSARNARKHGLSGKLDLDAASRAEIQSVARDLAGDQAQDPIILKCALEAAEARARVDLVRLAQRAAWDWALHDHRTTRRGLFHQTMVLEQDGQDLRARSKIAGRSGGARPASIVPKQLLHEYPEFYLPPVEDDIERHASVLNVVSDKLLKLKRYERRAVNARDKAYKKLIALQANNAPKPASNRSPRVVNRNARPVPDSRSAGNPDDATMPSTLEVAAADDPCHTEPGPPNGETKPIQRGTLQRAPVLPPVQATVGRNDKTNPMRAPGNGSRGRSTKTKHTPLTSVTRSTAQPQTLDKNLFPPEAMNPPNDKTNPIPESGTIKRRPGRPKKATQSDATGLDDAAVISSDTSLDPVKNDTDKTKPNAAAEAPAVGVPGHAAAAAVSGHSPAQPQANGDWVIRNTKFWKSRERYVAEQEAKKAAAARDKP